MNAPDLYRAHNQTIADQTNEFDAAIQIGLALDVSVLSLRPALYGVDWVFHRDGKPVGWGEFKKRSKAYATLHIGVSKITHARRLSADTGLPFTLFIGWPEGIFWWRDKGEPFPIVIAGNDRGQSGDKEPCYVIGRDLFRPLKAKRDA